MNQPEEKKNLIIAGVGGQGNILISRLIGQALIDEGYFVTIGETYGASHRGGSVASHVRISKDTQLGPLIPRGHAEVILGLEPGESLRILGLYGNQKTFVVTNTRLIPPLAAVSGEATYPSLDTIKGCIKELSQKAWYINASEIAIKLAEPLLANMVMVGALISARVLPLTQEMFERQLEINFRKEKLVMNLQAFRAGLAGLDS